MTKSFITIILIFTVSIAFAGEVNPPKKADMDAIQAKAMAAKAYALENLIPCEMDVEDAVAATPKDFTEEEVQEIKSFVKNNLIAKSMDADDSSAK